jgi:1,2-diacylglycerol 3-alpha-glucosyltransferase
MKIGILVLFANSFGKRGIYNSQEIGMAKELAKRGHTVTIYKCVPKSDEAVNEQLSENLTYICKPIKTVGSNTVSDFCWLDRDIDALVCFSDIQPYTVNVYKWAKKNNIKFLPYIGIIESSGGKSAAKRFVSNILAGRIHNLYRKIPVLAKTNYVKNKLTEIGVKQVDVAPVGLDFDLLRKDYSDVSKAEARKELNLKPDAAYMLMVGRIAPGRNPLDCVSVFEKVRSKDSNYRLLVVGKGELKEQLFNELKKKGLYEYMDYVESIPNSDMWKAYLAVDCLVSFSKVEIFGMSILEAMYYELPIYVVHAPGPDDIIEDKVNGYLCDTTEKMAELILNSDMEAVKKAAHNRIVDMFSWKTTADRIEEFFR